MLRGVLVLLALVVSAAGCQKPKCRGELDRDELVRLQKLTEQGKDPCPEHLQPTITASRQGVKVGELLLDQKIPADGHVLRLDGVFHELKQNRETWKQLHPGDMFMAKPVVRIDPEVSAALGASTLASVAFAGYPNIHLVSGAIELDFGYAVPGPPRPDNERTPRDLYVNWLGAGRFYGQLREGNVVVADATNTLDGIVDFIVVSCSDSRVDVLALRPRGEFLSAAALMKRVLSRPELARRPPPVRFASEVAE